MGEDGKSMVALSAERDAYLRQRDEALGERVELLGPVFEPLPQRPHERLALLRDWVPSMDKDYLILKTRAYRAERRRLRRAIRRRPCRPHRPIASRVQ
jgi:hypothetical protein